MDAKVMRARIGAEEVRISYVRSGGPGGQNVNKVATRAVLTFDVRGSGSLSAEEKGRIERRLGRRVSSEGVVRVTAQSARTQSGNRRLAEERLFELLAGALTRAKARKKTKVPATLKRRRLEEKKRRGEVKKSRGAVRGE